MKYFASNTISPCSLLSDLTRSFFGFFVNFIFAVASQFAGAVATSEFLLYFDYFARKEWGENYTTYSDNLINCEYGRPKTIRNQIHQYFQQVVYSINQPSAARGFQSVFWNILYFGICVCHIFRNLFNC